MLRSLGIQFNDCSSEKVIHNCAFSALEMSKAQSVHSPEVEQINRQLQSTQSVEYIEKNLSSLVWICSSTQAKGCVMVSRTSYQDHTRAPYNVWMFRIHRFSNFYVTLVSAYMVWTVWQTKFRMRRNNANIKYHSIRLVSYIINYNSVNL